MTSSIFAWISRGNREQKAIILQLALVVFYATLVLGSGLVKFDEILAIWLIYLSGAYALWAIFGMFVLIGMLLTQMELGQASPPLGQWLKSLIMERWERDRGLSLIALPFLLATLISAFNAFKQFILVKSTFRFDALFEQWDHILFLGHDPWQVTHALFGSLAATSFLDHVYHAWFSLMPLGVLLCAWQSKSTWRLRTQFLLSYIGVWILLGSILAWFLPAAGPVFVPALVGPSPTYSDLHAALMQTDAHNSLESIALQQMLLGSHTQTKMAMGVGISAMPSVHNALAILYCLTTFAINRKLGILFGLYAFAIWIGSIHLGWHYAVDGVASLILMIGLWKLTGLVAERLDKQAVSPEYQRAAEGSLAV